MGGNVDSRLRGPDKCKIKYHGSYADERVERHLQHVAF